MGLFIKKEEMPESCYECAYAIEEDGICSITEGGCDWGHSRPPHCPLEEIDLVRCKECKKSKLYAMNSSLPISRWCHRFSVPVAVEDDDYCSYAERRNDE